MTKNKINKGVRLIALILLIIYSREGIATVKLPALVGDGMVLQRNKDVRIWGEARPGEIVHVEFNKRSYQVVTGSTGNWEIWLPPLHAGGPFTMTIKGDNKITLSDIMMGDVWVCSGQSNMAYRMESVRERYEDEIARSTNPDIRQFVVEQELSYKEKNDVHTVGWKKASPENILKFSAVAYFFSKEIYEKYKIPVGIINTSYGGTSVTGWLSLDALKSFPSYAGQFDRYNDPVLVKNTLNKDTQSLKEWVNNIEMNDSGLNGNRPSWVDPKHDISTWKRITVPGYWANQGLDTMDRLVYFRRDLILPKGTKGKTAVLYLGHINGADTTYVNGVKVGSIRNINAIRKYVLPDDLLREGHNIIVVRVLNNGGNGGFVVDKPYKLVVNEKEYSLQGEWNYKVCVQSTTFSDNKIFKERDVPTVQYNAMIHPFLKLCFKGVLWYQGENDIYKAKDYEMLFPALVNNWRAKFNQGNFPFLFVQLPSYHYGPVDREPVRSEIAELREAQTKALRLPNTGMVVIYDVGEYNDIHPKNKLDVGKRLALLADKLAYNHHDLVCSGPVYDNMAIEKNVITVKFKDIGGGLAIHNGTELACFSIAGSDRKFYWANARIDGDRVVVWSDKVTNPVAVRYAWADNINKANLFNKEQLPAPPFRTDNWDF